MKQKKGGKIQVKQQVKEKSLLEVSQAENKVAHRTVTVQPFVVKFSRLMHYQVLLIAADLLKNRKRYSSGPLTRIFQFLSIQIAFVIVLSHEKTGSSHIPLVRSIGSSFKRETCVSGGNLIKIYTNQCQVVNGKKQCPVYCNGRGTFDQQTSGYYMITIYTIIEKDLQLSSCSFHCSGVLKWLYLLTLRYY